MSDALLAAAGKIADAVAEFYGTDRDQLTVTGTFGAAIIGAEGMEPWNWATEWPTFLGHIGLLAELKVEVMTTADGDMAVRLRPVKPKPIEWKTERFGFLVGSVDGIDLFTVSPNTSSRDEGKYFMLESQLPGGMRRAPIPGPAENAKADAERLLAAFIERITA